MEEEKKRSRLSLSLLDDDLLDLDIARPSRTLTDLILLMKFIESREARIIESMRSAEDKEIKKMVAERMLRLIDRVEESMNSITELMNTILPLMLGTVKKVDKGESGVKVEVR
ncbi:MAG: hypothetical protein QXW41_08070 [Fervidicoccaceae archaeon]